MSGCIVVWRVDASESGWKGGKVERWKGGLVDRWIGVKVDRSVYGR